MKRSLYRKHSTHKCKWCDHPAWCPSKKVNGKNACAKCRKNNTQRKRGKNYEID